MNIDNLQRENIGEDLISQFKRPPSTRAPCINRIKKHNYDNPAHYRYYLITCSYNYLSHPQITYTIFKYTLQNSGSRSYETHSRYVGFSNIIYNQVTKLHFL